MDCKYLVYSALIYLISDLIYFPKHCKGCNLTYSLTVIKWIKVIAFKMAKCLCKDHAAHQLNWFFPEILHVIINLRENTCVSFITLNHWKCTFSKGEADNNGRNGVWLPPRVQGTGDLDISWWAVGFEFFFLVSWSFETMFYRPCSFNFFGFPFFLLKRIRVT